MDLLSILAPPLPIPLDPSLHAPDRFLSVGVALAMWAVTIVVLAVAVRETNRTMDERSVPLMGVMAAFIFAAQMFNFQVFGGTSGHLLGGVLAAILLGPWAGTLVMACVVAVQALVFSDGGLVVMGANIFNMGVVGTLGGYTLYRALCRVMGGEDKARVPASAIAVVGRGRRGVGLHVGRDDHLGHQPGRGRAAGDARRPLADRHRRGPDHGRGGGVHREQPA